MRNHGNDKKLSPAAFRGLLAYQFGKVGDRINLERIELAPLFTADDHFFFTVVGGLRTRGVPADPTPPFKLYRANVNQARVGTNPLKGFRTRWYSTP